jgi:hypothetical protein
MKNKIIILGMLALSISAFAQETGSKEKSREKEIQGVSMTKTKKAVEQKPDRTIFDFSEQPNLNSGTTLEGIKKLPGMVVTDIADDVSRETFSRVYGWTPSEYLE